MQRKSSLRRRAPSRCALPRILLVCEGEKTEPSYFQGLRIGERVPVELKLKCGGMPKTLVEWAVELKDEADRNASQRGDANLAFDSVWCVFDVDAHPRIPDAKVQARANGISLAISNPCFELWLLHHFRDHSAPIGRDKLQKLLRRHLPKYAKAVSYEDLRGRRADAAERASRLEKWHETRGTAGGNPSTSVHRLVSEILDYAAKR